MPRTRILITGVGSLLGQNLLDALESRRALLEVVGTNAAVDSTRIMRCDRTHLVPHNDHPGYATRLSEIIREELPDLVFPGRDPDVVVLAEIAKRQPDLASRLVVGSVEAAALFEDKFLTWQFAQRHCLPFAATLCTGSGLDSATLSGFIAEHGFPLIAKPRFGAGSIGVRVVLNASQLAHAAALPEYVLQPFLGAGAQNYRCPSGDDAGVPLFHAPPDAGQYAGQCVIGPSGACSEIFCGLHVMIMGRCEQMWAVDEPEFRATTVRFAAAISREGWRGAFNLQCRRHTDGKFIGFEINGRSTGGTSGRLRLGFDEIGEVARAWLQPNPLPCLTLDQKPRGKIVKTLVDGFLPEMQAGEPRRATG